MRDNSSNSKVFKSLQLFCTLVGQSPTKLIKYKAARVTAPVSLAALLGLGGVGWLVTAAIAPPIARAYTARVDVSINFTSGESYQTLLRRAEALARAAAQRSFDQDILVTEVAVTVLAQNEGAIAPVLSLEVTRVAWKSRPDPQRWAKYYPTSQALLQIQDPAAQPAATPTPPGPPPGAIPVPPPPPPTPPNAQPANPGVNQDPNNPPPALQQPGNAPTAPQNPPPTLDAQPQLAPETGTDRPQ